eukprot:COSAG04_NODE_18905_length_429_cov_26.287879_1_plen_100_part_10
MSARWVGGMAARGVLTRRTALHVELASISTRVEVLAHATINAVRKSVTADITHVRTHRTRQACRWRHATRRWSIPARSTHNAVRLLVATRQVHILASHTF